MDDPIVEAVQLALEQCFDGLSNADDFIQYLEEFGFMVVPIEDPTNLFGIQRDD